MLVYGDCHGDWNKLISSLKEYKNTEVIQLGDFGVGFESLHKERNRLKFLNDWLRNKNITMYVLRGNHDDPKYFYSNKADLINYWNKRGNVKNVQGLVHEISTMTNLKLVPDWSVIKIKDRNCLFIGGAISSDIESRKLNTSWWSDERILFDWELINSISGVETVFSHTSPDFIKIYSREKEWRSYPDMIARKEHIKSMDYEQFLLTEVYKLLKDNNNHLFRWYHGHFDVSLKRSVDYCWFRSIRDHELIDYEVDRGTRDLVF
jgi:hypothetical protein